MLNKDKNKKTAILNGLDANERLLIKKLLLGDEDTIKKISLKSIDFNTAIIQEEPMTIAVPSNIVKKLKDDYISKICECESSLDSYKQNDLLIKGNNHDKN